MSFSGWSGRIFGTWGSISCSPFSRADGLIVTNRHVVAGARTILVKLSTGQQLPAKDVGADAATDLALLKIAARQLPALHLGSSANVSVGDEVIAIGNPFGLGQTVSARGPTMEDDPYIDFLQTDAAINFGNSGGSLLSADGFVVGVTSAIFSPSGFCMIGICYFRWKLFRPSSVPWKPMAGYSAGFSASPHSL
jgi:S1-C subfamily serine protease